MATKIEEFLKDKKIDARRLMAASASIESFTREDRGLRLIKRTARKSEDAAKKKEGLAAKKPRTGRPVTNRSFSAAIAGKQIAGAQKTRILRAVNLILAQKKQDAVELSALFENTARPVKKVEKKAE